MEVVILQDRPQIGRVSADAVAGLLNRKPDAVLGLATGSSPLMIYDELAARYEAGELSFRQAVLKTPSVMSTTALSRPCRR